MRCADKFEVFGEVASGGSLQALARNDLEIKTTKKEIRIQIALNLLRK